MVHDDFDAGSKVLELVSGGWPQALSALKTTLETDAILAAARSLVFARARDRLG